MFPILNQMPVENISIPDVCITQPPGPVPPIPIVYPNSANEALGFPAVNYVLVGGAPAHNISSVVSLSTGDLPGIMGVASGTVLGPATTMGGSPKLLLGYLPAKRVSSWGMSNGINCPFVALIPNQIKVFTSA